MAKDLQQLNKYEEKLSNDLMGIMKEKKVNFSVFLPVLVDKVPSKDTAEYYKILKKEQMKLRRGSLSVQELHEMLNILNIEIRLTLNNKPVKLVKYSLDEKVRYTDLMRVAELLNIHIEWVKLPDGRSASKEEQK